MFFRRLSLPTKLYLAVSLPIALTFVLSAIAYVGLGQVLEDVRSKSDSDLVFERLTELSVVIERTGRLMGEPGSQQQVQARLTPVVARFKELAATVSESDAVRDRGIADRLAAEAGRLDEFVHATMLARGNITEAQLLLPSALASFAEVSMQMSAGLGGLAAADAVPLNATFSQQASALLDAAGSYASQLDKAQFESVRQVISDFSDQIEKSARALKSAGQDGRALERSMERSRSKIYGLVMQLGAATDRFDTLGAQVTGILDEARQAAATLKSLGHAAEAAQVARMSWWAGAIALGALLALAIGFGMAILMPVLISRGIVKPLGALERTMKALAKGDTDVQVGGTSRHDAIGSMALAVVVFRDSIRETERLRADKAEETRRSAERRQTELHRFADQFHSAVGPMIETVSSAATELEAAAGNLAAIADHTQQLSTSAANAFAQASANVQIVAEATESLGSSIGEIAHQTERSNTIATQAVHQADATNLRIGELSQAADRIGDVVNLISAIAGQTNLLALNAAIESARAGEAGKGFAVVAQEVKALAARTATATHDIDTQVVGIQTATEDSVSAIEEIGGTIKRISDIASVIRKAVEEQEAASQQIVRNVRQATLGTSQAAEDIVDVSRGARETEAASSAVLVSARSLSNESARLKVEIANFLARVRAS